MRREEREMPVLRLLLTLVAVLVIACSPGRAHATDVPAQGGPGGGGFRLQCPPNFFMLGVALRSGSWVDAIRANCVGFDASTQQFAGAPQFTAFTGGNGGGQQQNGCPQDRYVSAIKIGFTRDGNKPKYLDYVELTCTVLSGYGGDTRVCLHTGEQCWDRHPSPGPYNGWGLSFRVACPAGQAAIGLIGRSGIYVDALGLICGPKPAPAEASGGSPYVAMMRRCRATGGTWNYVTHRCIRATGGGGLSAEEQAILNAHNVDRAKHCVPNLTWSADLAASAQTWANACTKNNQGGFAHSPDAWKSENGFGENLAWGTGLSAQGAVDLWYGEIRQYNFDAPVWSSAVGHFTQVVWRNSKQLGCAVHDCDGRNLWVCRYSPTGNWNVDESRVPKEQARQTLMANVPKACK